MFQLKISAVILGVVLLVTVPAYFLLTSSVTDTTMASEDEKLAIASRGVQAVLRDAEMSLQSLSRDLSTRPTLVGLFSSTQQEISRELQAGGDAGGDNDSIIKKAASRDVLWKRLVTARRTLKSKLRAEITQNSLGNPEIQHTLQLERDSRAWFGEAPDLVLAFQPFGEGKNRFITLIAFAEDGQNLKAGQKYDERYPMLAEVIDSRRTALGLIAWETKDYVVAAAPVSDGRGRVVGVLVVGYEMSNALLDRLSTPLEREQHLVLSFNDLYYARSTSTGVKRLAVGARYRQVDVSQSEEQVDVEVADEEAALGFGEMSPGRSYLGEVDGAQYMVRVIDWRPARGSSGAMDEDGGQGEAAGGETGDGEGKEPALASGSGARLMVLSNYTVASKPARQIAYAIPLIGTLIIIALLLATLLISNNFIKPLEEIDVGIQEVLAGRRDYNFRARSGHSLHAELANSLNQLVAFLQGEDEEDEEGWEQLMVDLEPERPSYYGLQAVQIVSDDEEQASLRRLYDEYTGKRAAHGQEADMDFDRFVRRIKRNEGKLKEKHKCSSVDFSVVVRDGKVVLKPKLNYG